MALSSTISSKFTGNSAGRQSIRPFLIAFIIASSAISNCDRSGAQHTEPTAPGPQNAQVYRSSSSTADDALLERIRAAILKYRLTTRGLDCVTFELDRSAQ